MSLGAALFACSGYHIDKSHHASAVAGILSLIARFDDHICGMRLHALFMIAAGAMVAMSAFLVLRAHHKVESRRAGLIDVQSSNPVDNGLMPAEQTCEKPR
jgi:hypothetical protein